MDRIKRLSYEVLDQHKSKFGEDFAENKKALDQISIIRSKGLKNEIAGYITKFIKKEIREKKSESVEIESSETEIPEVTESETVNATEEEIIDETNADTPESETTEVVTEKTE